MSSAAVLRSLLTETSENARPGESALIDGNIATVIDFIETEGHPSDLALNNSAKVYLLNGGIFEVDMNTLTVAQDTFINRFFDAINYFFDQDRLYAAESQGYTQNGKTVIYDVQGAAVDSFNVGIAPNGFHFVVN
ncbi:MAG TPA: hypothetical protein VK074_09595 [Fodinibius sp.]|nr:hypothetical protein [Fodinibius sp.]